MYVTTQQRADAIISEIYFERERSASEALYRWTWRTIPAGSAQKSSSGRRHAQSRRASGTLPCRLHFACDPVSVLVEARSRVKARLGLKVLVRLLLMRLESHEAFGG
jgi:hypothetical protein